MIRAEELPASVRARLGLGPEARPSRSPKRSRAGVGPGALCAGRCAGCGQTFDRYTRFERDHTRPGHRRWIIDL